MTFQPGKHTKTPVRKKRIASEIQHVRHVGERIRKGDTLIVKTLSGRILEITVAFARRYEQFEDGAFYLIRGDTYQLFFDTDDTFEEYMKTQRTRS